jgi:hypothetical protein
MLTTRNKKVTIWFSTSGGVTIVAIDSIIIYNTFLKSFKPVKLVVVYSKKIKISNKS